VTTQGLRILTDEWLKGSGAGFEAALAQIAKNLEVPPAKGTTMPSGGQNDMNWLEWIGYRYDESQQSHTCCCRLLERGVQCAQDFEIQSRRGR
jgi:hypothetical protein